ncbi:enoyl-ACP reductase FabV [Oceanispirochaeta sp.]|jgi:enoyl-[acyl-carrier protein] reductase/trans-2-enoyl-CoA reductase (NAD+)|uniref:enoyl-ACP reductase FabV n=1 Tax=Oceanispirochaeta sp. TaxID=2035350 RepID=UPI00262E1EB4|nr:enoyl-ACP reductase FabV [Oceanispirochaeta sp.]MDA3959033.1 trans-2-enoyl-CoA reductase family protein [Oceanispirochaeta sp.]
MIIEPKIIKSVCLTAHPEGCEKEVENQIGFVKGQGALEMPKRILIVGCSTGFGLASRITAAFAGGAETLGVSFEKGPSPKRTASPGWYNNRAFDKFSKREGIKSFTIDGDAFSDDVKSQAIHWIKENWGQVDLLVYSLASPVRVDPETGETYRSVLKPIGKSYTAQSVDFMNQTVNDVTIEPADEEEIAPTVKVMGGEDWMRWTSQFKSAGILAEGFRTVSYSYIGPDVTYPVYREGTIGKAKENLENSAAALTTMLKDVHGQAFVSVNKALVTRASSVIPVVPLYMALLFKVMKEKGIHEGCIEQMYRLFKDRLKPGKDVPVDEKGRIRIDDWEMREDVQSAVSDLWDQVTTENVSDLSDIKGFREDYLKLHGFNVDGIDYDKEVDLSAF